MIIKLRRRTGLALGFLRRSALICVAVDLTGSLQYVATPSASRQIDEDLDDHRLDLTPRKEILWESETTPLMPRFRRWKSKQIRETGANNPAIGYNRSPRYRAT
jgi:hypothetical protein